MQAKGKLYVSRRNEWVYKSVLPRYGCSQKSCERHTLMLLRALFTRTYAFPMTSSKTGKIVHFNQEQHVCIYRPVNYEHQSELETLPSICMVPFGTEFVDWIRVSSVNIHESVLNMIIGRFSVYKFHIKMIKIRIWLLPQSLSLNCAGDRLQPLDK